MFPASSRRRNTKICASRGPGPLEKSQGPGEILLLQGRQDQVAVIAARATARASATGPASRCRPRRTSRFKPSISGLLGRDPRVHHIAQDLPQLRQVPGELLNALLHLAVILVRPPPGLRQGLLSGSAQAPVQAPQPRHRAQQFQQAGGDVVPGELLHGHFRHPAGHGAHQGAGDGNRLFWP